MKKKRKGGLFVQIISSEKLKRGTSGLIQLCNSKKLVKQSKGRDVLASLVLFEC